MINPTQLFNLFRLYLGQATIHHLPGDIAQWLIQEQLVEPAPSWSLTDKGNRVVLYATKKAEEQM